MLLVVKDGVLLHTLNTSTGSGERYFSGGSWHTATTPSGTFKVSRQIDGWRHAELGDLWRPKYFNGGIAIHGSTSVPPVPASHGCCRVSITAMNHTEHRGAARGDRARLLTTLLTTGTVALTTGTVALTNEMSRQRQGRRGRPLRLARIPSGGTTLPCCGRPGAETRTPAGCR